MSTWIVELPTFPKKKSYVVPFYQLDKLIYTWELARALIDHIKHMSLGLRTDLEKNIFFVNSNEFIFFFFTVAIGYYHAINTENLTILHHLHAMKMTFLKFFLICMIKIQIWRKIKNKVELCGVNEVCFFQVCLRNTFYNTAAHIVI